jgi:hypothetical protein
MKTTKKALSIVAGSLLASTAAVADQWTTTGAFDGDVDVAGCLASAGVVIPSWWDPKALATALSSIKLVGSGVAGMTVTRQGNNGTVKHINLAASLQSASMGFVSAAALAEAEANSVEIDRKWGVCPWLCGFDGIAADAEAEGEAGSWSLSNSLAKATQYVSVSGKNIDELWGGLYLGTLQFNMSEAAVDQLTDTIAGEMEGGCLLGFCGYVFDDEESAEVTATARALARAIAGGGVTVTTLAHFKDNKGPGSLVDQVDVWTNANAYVWCSASAQASAGSY